MSDAAREPRRAIVTGAASGLGRAFAECLAKPGRKIVVADIDLNGAEKTVAALEAKGAEALAVRLDVTDPDSVAEVVDRVEQDFLKEIDLIVNNAGVAAYGRVGDIPLRDWRWVVDVNLWGVIYGCRVVAPKMRRRRTGQIINIASIAGLVSPPEVAPYNVTKAGVIALSETLHGELKRHGVHVTVVCPSFFQTRILDSARGTIRPQFLGAAQKMMSHSRVQAPEVAAFALKAVRRNQLYALPMADARAMWRLKRALPTRFQKVWSTAERFVTRKGQ